MAASIYPASEPPDGSHHNHNQHFTLQKYLLLHEQHESLRLHLEQLRPAGTGSESTITSPGGSPTRGPSSLQSSPYSSRSPSKSRSHTNRRASLPAAPPRQHYAFSGYIPRGVSLDTVLDESTMQEVAMEEAKLFDVNEGIKRALTELLNCEAVRSDQAFRNWVQCRLMDTERELRVGRRRRSAPGADY